MGFILPHIGRHLGFSANIDRLIGVTAEVDVIWKQMTSAVTSLSMPVKGELGEGDKGLSPLYGVAPPMFAKCFKKWEPSGELQSG